MHCVDGPGTASAEGSVDSLPDHPGQIWLVPGPEAHCLNSLRVRWDGTRSSLHRVQKLRPGLHRLGNARPTETGSGMSQPSLSVRPDVTSGAALFIRRNEHRPVRSQSSRVGCNERGTGVEVVLDSHVPLPYPHGRLRLLALRLWCVIESRWCVPSPVVVPDYPRSTRYPERDLPHHVRWRCHAVQSGCGWISTSSALATWPRPPYRTSHVLKSIAT
jgi:hypothetical protein